MKPIARLLYSLLANSEMHFFKHFFFKKAKFKTQGNSITAVLKVIQMWTNLFY